jgi:hypothetical protein
MRSRPNRQTPDEFSGRVGVGRVEALVCSWAGSRFSGISETIKDGLKPRTAKRNVGRAKLRGQWPKSQRIEQRAVGKMQCIAMQVNPYNVLCP